MTQKHALNTEMAEQRYGIVIRSLRTVIPAFTPVSMSREQLIKLFCNMSVFLECAAFGKILNVKQNFPGKVNSFFFPR
jgi:hypothetical protein